MIPVVVNNNNFARGGDGPTLLSADDVRTLFHEFGHGLHGMLSDVRYGRLSGTQVPQDYVELPSQLMENWANVPEVLARHARHVTTGEAIPAGLLERMRAAQSFNQGFETVAYTASALIDLALHLHPDPAGLDIARFEHEERERLGVPREVGMRHRLPHFNHLFSGAGLCGRLLRLYVGRGPRSRSVRRLRGNRRPVRPGAGRQAATPYLCRRRQPRTAHRVPRLPRPRSAGHADVAQARAAAGLIPACSGIVHGRGTPVRERCNLQAAADAFDGLHRA
ncbi:MAG: M3 family metallopeptidase [Pararobbsia sp.]